jgi:hypothetical protein
MKDTMVVNTGQWCFIRLSCTKEDKATRVFYPEYYTLDPWEIYIYTTPPNLVTRRYQCMESSYEKISRAILAGVLRDDIECTGMGVIHTPSRLKWVMSLDT